MQPNRILGIIIALSSFLGSGGCVTTSNLHRYSQAQLNAIESRIVDAELEETYQAATNALFDAGYTIQMSDRVGGIVTGYRGKDNSAARFWVSPLIRDTQYLISIQMRKISARQTNTRVKTSTNGEPYVNEDAINEIWKLMQRQVLMKAPMVIEEGD